MLILLPIPGDPLRAKFVVLILIDKKVSDVDCIVCTPDRRKTKRMYEVDMLRGYNAADDDTKPVLNQNTVTSDTCDDSDNPGEDFVINGHGCNLRLENADMLSNLESKVSHLESSQQSMYPDSNHVFDGGGYNVDIPSVECNIDIVTPIECTICDAEFQVRLKQCEPYPLHRMWCSTKCVIQ